jgi:hypothetical protein
MRLARTAAGAADGLYEQKATFVEVKFAMSNRESTVFAATGSAP